MGNYFRIFEYIHDTRKNANKPNHTYIDRNGEQQTDKQIERNDKKIIYVISVAPIKSDT